MLTFAFECYIRAARGLRFHIIERQTKHGEAPRRPLSNTAHPLRVILGRAHPVV